MQIASTEKSEVDDEGDIAEADSMAGLALSPGQMKQFFELAPFAVAMFDREMKYLAHSKRWAQAYGFGDKSLVGQSQYDLLPNMSDEWRNRYDKCLSGTEFDTQESKYVGADGKVVWVKWQMSPWKQENGDIGGVILFSIFVNQAKTKERELEKNQKFLRTVLDNVQDGIVVCDADGKLVLYNTETLHLFGIPDSSIPFEQWNEYYNLCDPKDLIPIGHEQSPLIRILNGEKILGEELAVVSKSGTTKIVVVRGQPMFDSENNKLGAVLSMNDITDRKRMDRALRRSEAQFRGAFQTSPQGMALISPTGNWLTANKALCDVLGYDEKELLGQGIEKLTHPDDLGSEIEDGGKMLAGEETTIQFEKRYLHKSGSTIWALVSITLVRDENNEPIQFVLQMLDLTKRKEVEQQLLQSQKLEAVGQLTGGLAHDFNNLLAVNLISLQLLERSHQDDEKSLKRIRAALNATERGAELTRRLLAFSRKQNLEERVIDVNGLINNTEDLLSRTLGGEIKFETHTENKLWQVKTDENQLESALLNLAINARDAMPNGGDLTIETQNVELNEDYAGTHTEVKAGRYVLIAVTDTGTGIPKDVIEKVFQPFFTTKDIGQGTGLGLSMVYGFVKQSEGHIEVYSETGIGTSIKLYLPATDVDVSDGSIAALQISEDAIGGDETILVTEDDPNVRESVKLLFESLGYTVVTAEDAATAIRVLETDAEFDLLFSDIVMPGGMNGVDLVDKARDIRPNLKVLLTSGFAEAAIAKSAKPLLSTEIIGKPYRREDLAIKVRGVLDG
ncbi:MAG: PAS domain S-box protein [Rhodospirillaceae bacterium]|nr:PAS domain S-box protein [Rhodospirillaceae bacterium]